MILRVVECAAFLLNQYEVGHDGKTAYERLKGRGRKGLGSSLVREFTWSMKQAKGALGKLDSKWRDGVYFGIKEETGEIIIGDIEGVWKTRTIRRKLEAERERPTHTSTVFGVLGTTRTSLSVKNQGHGRCRTKEKEGHVQGASGARR